MEVERVYREVAPKLQSYLTGNGCSYAMACDIVQETFLRLWNRRVELLETFALSRLGKLTVKDIASGMGSSEANVKVRVHRAKEMLGKVMKCGNMEVWKCGNGEMRKCGDGGNGEFRWAVFRAVMMLAAVDGEIDKEELSLYRELAERLRGGNAAVSGRWRRTAPTRSSCGTRGEGECNVGMWRQFAAYSPNADRGTA